MHQPALSRLGQVDPSPGRARSQGAAFGRLQEARERTGACWIVIDPRRTLTAEAADIHLQITAGTDVALLLSLLQTCIQHHLLDRQYIGEHTSGFEEVAAVAAGWPPERAAPLCGIDATLIRRTAHLIAGSTASLSLWCQGLNHAVTGTMRSLGLINLHLATGQIGRPGAGPFSLTGQANAMGGREVGGMATELAAHRRLADPDDRDEVRRFWGSGPIDPSRADRRRDGRRTARRASAPCGSPAATASARRPTPPARRRRCAPRSSWWCRTSTTPRTPAGSPTWCCPRRGGRRRPRHAERRRRCSHSAPQWRIRRLPRPAELWLVDLGTGRPSAAILGFIAFYSELRRVDLVVLPAAGTMWHGERPGSRGRVTCS
jgi:hypothetical protein